MATTSNIDVSVDTLNSEFNKLDGYISELDDSIKKVKSIVDNIGECWKESSYTNVFNPKMEVFIEELEDIKEQVQSHRDYISGYVVSHTTLDTIFFEKNLEME